MKSFITSITIITGIVMKRQGKLASLLEMVGTYPVFKPCLTPHVETSTKMGATKPLLKISGYISSAVLL